MCVSISLVGFEYVQLNRSFAEGRRLSILEQLCPGLSERLVAHSVFQRWVEFPKKRKVFSRCRAIHGRFVVHNAKGVAFVNVGVQFSKL